MAERTLARAGCGFSGTDVKGFAEIVDLFKGREVILNEHTFKQKVATNLVWYRIDLGRASALASQGESGAMGELDSVMCYLSPHSAQLLKCLWQHDCKATFDEIEADVWGASVVVGEEALRKSVRRLRERLMYVRPSWDVLLRGSISVRTVELYLGQK